MLTGSQIKFEDFCLFGRVDEQTNAEEEVTIVDCFSSLKGYEVTPRKVLSPINSNINNENLSMKDQIHLICNQQTPMSSLPLSSFDENIPALGTPLDKFGARSSNLKVRRNLILSLSSDCLAFPVIIIISVEYTELSCPRVH